MDTLRAFDATLFRFINIDLSNPWFDGVLPFFSSNPFFLPAALVSGAILGWKGGIRGRLFLFALLAVTALGDGVICHQLKDWIDRPRPFWVIPEANLLVGRGRSASMPSSHAANWFAAAVVAGVYYRRTLWWILPLAGVIAFSRVYVGVHYLSDVIAGALLGITYAFAILWAIDSAWQYAGRRWFPIWWSALPSIRSWPNSSKRTVSNPPIDTIEARSTESASLAPMAIASEELMKLQWIRVGYLLIGVLLLARLAYIASDAIELSEDEAYQWLWSKHLDLSYYSKPPLIAYTQFLGTTLWGDTAFGVRFFSPVIAALLSGLVFRFLAREVNVRAAFAVLCMVTVAPMLAVGATLLTIDPLSVLFWTAALVTGWRALQRDSTGDWLWTGLFVGLGFLSKYTGLFQWLCWAVFFALWKPARRQLRRPGPYWGLLVTLLCTIPVLVWNAQNGWITVTHLAERGGLDESWSFEPKYLWNFVTAELGLLNPIFFVGAIWAACRFWKREWNALSVYLFSMGAPVFAFYLIYTLRAQVQPNWIAPSVAPLFCLAAIYWEERYRRGDAKVRPVFIAGVVLGLALVLILHDTDLVRKVTGRPLPAKLDPLRRVRGWTETARVVEQARQELLREGKPVFLIGDHYGITGLLSFYIPEARVAVPHDRWVYFESTDRPVNQFFFWQGYRHRKGENALYVQRVNRPKPPPTHLEKEFESVTSLGVREIQRRGQVLHRFELFACRNLK